MQDGIFSFNKFVFSIVLLYRFIKAMDLWSKESMKNRSLCYVSKKNSIEKVATLKSR